MVLNKILQPIISPFAKPKWQSRNQEIRKKAIQELENKEQEVISRIAMNETDENLRAIAIDKLNDIDLLQSIIMKGTNVVARQAASLRYFQLLAGEKEPVPEMTVREKIIKGSRNSALLEYIAAHAVEPALRISTIKKIGRDALLGDIALNDPDAEVRQAAAMQVAKRSTIERVLKQSRRKDKRVYKIIREKLDRIIEDEERPLLIAREVVEICDKLEKLYKRGRLLQEKTTFENYLKRWSEIHRFATDETVQHYETITSQISAAIAKLEQDKARQHEAVEKIELILSKLSVAVNDLLEARESGDKDNLTSKQHNIKELEKDWNNEIKFIANNDLKKYQNQFREILDLSSPHETETEATDEVEKLEALTFQASNMLKNSQFPGEKSIQAMAHKFSTLYAAINHDLPDVQGLKHQFDHSLTLLKEQLKEQQHLREVFKEEFQQAVEKLEDHLQNGQLSNADSVRKKILADLDAATILPNGEIQQYKTTLRKYMGQLGELSGWRNWAHNKERENLISKAEKLQAAVKTTEHLEVQYQDFANQVKLLRQEWKKLKSNSPDELWDRFNNACNDVFELCKPCFDKEAEKRSENLVAKKILCQQLEDYIQSMHWPSPEESQFDQTIDWMQVDKIVHQARAEWRSIGHIDRKNYKSVTHRFDTALAIIHTELKKVWSHNQSLYYELIDKVKALHEIVDEDLDTAIQKSKQYQQDWKTIGPVSAFQRNKLWRKFRSNCDYIFDKRQQINKQRDHDKQEIFRQKQAICENLEALNQQPLGIDDLRHAYKEILALWKDVEHIEKSSAQKLHKRFAEATEEYNKKIAALEQEKKNQQLDVFKSKIALCEQLEQMPEYDQNLVDSISRQFENQSEVSLSHAMEAVLNTRFKSALENISSDKTALTADELIRKQQFCLKHEILTGKPSPEPEQQKRMEMQVELLNSSMGHINEAQLPDMFELQLQWYTLTNYANDAGLNERFNRLIS